MKQKTITLQKFNRLVRHGDVEWPRNNAVGQPATRWLVMQVTNSLLHSPGEELTREQVEDLLGGDDWNVKFIKEGLKI